MIDHWPDPHAQREAHFQQTIALLEQRLEEQQAQTRHWMEVVKRQGAVISAAREHIPECLDEYDDRATGMVHLLAALAALDKQEAKQ